jgi:tetratricopeptide (TPR) repeat protein
MIRKAMLMFVLVACALSLRLTGAAFMQTEAGKMQEADALFQAQKWEEAAGAYEAITKAEPERGLAWYRLGFALNSLGRYKQGAAALERAVAIGKRPESMYALAHSYALMNDKDHAFEWLNKALAANLPQPRQIKRDRNLENLRADPRFTSLLELAEKKARVCMNIPEYRQFDFWVGDWNVFGTNGQQLGTNQVLLLEDGCIIEENWTSAQGGTGKSFNFYNPATKKWHQSYMDNTGSNWMMDGEYRDGVLRYEGMIYAPGSTVMVRMNFYNLGADKVRQTAETSTDKGLTWTSVWDGLYVRKK